MEKIRINQDQTIYEVIWTETPLAHLDSGDLLVTDHNLFALHSDQLGGWDPFVLKPGESAKSLETAERLVDWMMDRGADRQTRLVALGGGVVSDLVGFVASIYKRGCRWVAIPTTLLAMVDAAVGGKTAVNHGGIKNSLGTFHPPEQVLVDTAWLLTLPETEWLSGKGEVLKYAFLDREVARHLSESPVDWPALIRACLMVKKRYVEADPYDRSLRQHLNLGHTYGHALEMSSGLAHGVAVAIGIRLVILHHTDGSLLPIFDALTEALGLEAVWDGDRQDLTPYLLHDKKGKQGQKALIVPTALGEVEIRYVNHEI